MPLIWQMTLLWGAGGTLHPPAFPWLWDRCLETQCGQDHLGPLFPEPLSSAQRCDSDGPCHRAGAPGASPSDLVLWLVFEISCVNREHPKVWSMHWQQQHSGRPQLFNQPEALGSGARIPQWAWGSQKHSCRRTRMIGLLL